MNAIERQQLYAALDKIQGSANLALAWLSAVLTAHRVDHPSSVPGCQTCVAVMEGLVRVEARYAEKVVL